MKKSKTSSASKKSKTKKRAEHAKPSHLPEVAVLVITQITDDGDLIAAPVSWDKERTPPHIVVTESGRQKAAIVGDKVLAKLRKIRPHVYQALVIKLLPGDQPKAVLGVFVATGAGGLIEPVSRKQKESFMVAAGDTGGAQHGDLVSGITMPGVPTISMSYAKITERLGRLDSPRAASLIAASQHALPSVFGSEAIAEAEAAEAPVLTSGRVDLRDIPLVTIDGEDARDFDDAVFAEADGDGFHLVVAIADVAYYVQEESSLDHEAFNRGNSVYFPDRVIPMLPEHLSNGLCSLVPNEDRYCVAVHLWIDAEGRVKRYKFVRGLMRSVARLTYEQVDVVSGQSSKLGKDNSSLNSELRTLITNLNAAYRALSIERDARGSLNLNLPEYKILFDKDGNVSAIAPRPSLESHRLIESFMIAANVAAADFLLANKAPGVYRVHEAPSDEKLEDLRKMLQLSGHNVQKGGIRAVHFNRILAKVKGELEEQAVNTAVLRAQMQAFYSAENLGHFGLSLQKYAHFTSPIRRYADLVVHRSIVKLVDGGRKAVDGKKSNLADVALHISETERKAMMAERDAADRYKVSFMTRHIDHVFPGVIQSLNEYGLFVLLDNMGITGFVPVRNLPGDFYHFDRQHMRFSGQRSRRNFTTGQPIIIRVQEANGMTGSLIFAVERGSDEPLALLREFRPHKDKGKRRRGKRG